MAFSTISRNLAIIKSELPQFLACEWGLSNWPSKVWISEWESRCLPKVNSSFEKALAYMISYLPLLRALMILHGIFRVITRRVRVAGRSEVKC
jgi:hypothetical protein